MLTTAERIARVTSRKQHTSYVFLQDWGTEGTQPITLPVARTWQAMWQLCLQTSLFGDYLSLPQVSETLCFSDSFMKGKNKPTDHAHGVNKMGFKSLCFWERGENSSRQIHDGQLMTGPCCYRMVSTVERNSALISCPPWGCPEYYVNQNDEWKLPQTVQMLWVSYKWNLRLIICLYLLLTYSMVQSPSWEANWFAASQEIPRILWNPKVHYRIHKLPPPVPILG